MNNTDRSADSCLQISRIEAWAYRYPIENPVKTSFGVMWDRPAVFLRIEDSDGCFGWGEIFANWPAAGAEHRVNLLIQDIAELVLDRPFESPGHLFQELSAKTRVRALQCGEWGPFRQVIAGLDIAMWDLVARKNTLPVYKQLNASAADKVPTYASGLFIGDAEHLIDRARAEGFRCYKVKIGFAQHQEVSMLNDIADRVREGESLYADANQSWNLKQALDFTRQVNTTTIGWLEEPIAADRPQAEWIQLASMSPIPLAGGENIAGASEFYSAITAGALSVIQPDLVKWGGFSGCFPVAQQILQAQKKFCPHFLGGGIGLVASAHLLSAAGGDGLLEVDYNPNPLRDIFRLTGCQILDGQWHFPGMDSVGLGFTELPEETGQWLTHKRSVAA